MKRTLLVVTVGAFLAAGTISGTVAAQGGSGVKGVAASMTTQEPAAKKPAHKHAAPKADQTGPNAKSDLQVKAQPTGPEPSAPVAAGELALGSVKLPKKVTADGKPLAAGTYQVRLTPQEAETKATGATANYERWVEFVQGGQVKGREVVSIVPQAEASKVAKEPAPAPGHAKVEVLKGDDYLRVWINKAGTHYLIHLVNS